MTAPALSILVPMLDEAESIGALLDDLQGLTVAYEIIVADGGSSDDGVAIAAGMGAVVVHARRGRGSQLRAGAALATAPVLCVLHADVRLPPATVRALGDIARRGSPCAQAFRLRIDARGLAYHLVEAGANLRSRGFDLPYGDQGLVVDLATYVAAGGFADVPIMEDVLLVRALGKHGGVMLRREVIVASARRWQRDGVWRRSATNLSLLLRFLLGASPRDLARRYERAARGTSS